VSSLLSFTRDSVNFPSIHSGLTDYLVDFGHRVSDRTNHNNGGFGEYNEVKAVLQIKIPDNLSFEQAATLPVGVITCVRLLRHNILIDLMTYKK
jgi:NADPH:quinone reductase-like Zn-dependent oxidoreductase